MKKSIISLVFCTAAALYLTGCTTSEEPQEGSGVLVEDGTMQNQGQMGTMGGFEQGSLDPDGALVVGDPYAEQNQAMQGPQALRENNTIYFKYDSEQIQDAYVGVMQAHAQYLRDNPDSRIIIEGHTDERGTPEYNIALGERRARSVARYMQNLGVDVNQLSIVSYGEEKPVDPGHVESSWQKNRRAVINY